LLEVGTKAWTTAPTNVVPFLEVSFPTSPPTVLDVAGENLPMIGYLVGAFSVVSSLEAWLGFPVLQLLLSDDFGCPKGQAVLIGVVWQVVVFFLSLLVVN